MENLVKSSTMPAIQPLKSIFSNQFWFPPSDLPDYGLPQELEALDPTDGERVSVFKTNTGDVQQLRTSRERWGDRATGLGIMTFSFAIASMTTLVGAISENNVYYFVCSVISLTLFGLARQPYAYAKNLEKQSIDGITKFHNSSEWNAILWKAYSDLSARKVVLPEPLKKLFSTLPELHSSRFTKVSMLDRLLMLRVAHRLLENGKNKDILNIKISGDTEELLDRVSDALSVPPMPVEPPPPKITELVI